MAEKGSVIVRGSASGFAQEVEIGSHRLKADEPASVGGADSGPNPYDLLLAALGSCMSMTASLYARRKGWPLESVTVKLRHSRIHAEDCEACVSRDVMLDRIDSELGLTGPLSPEQRDRILEIAKKCPVHRTLTSEIEIRTRLA